MKQSAVEWLWEQIPYEFTSNRSAFEVFEQAKEIHKKEMIDFGNDLIAQNDSNYIGVPNLAEQYYNETYGSGVSEKPTNI